MNTLQQIEYLLGDYRHQSDKNHLEHLNITQQTIIKHFKGFFPLVNFYFENGHISEESRRQFKEYYPEEFI